MKLLSKSSDVLELIQKVKGNSGALITNFFIDSEKLDYWIDSKLFYIDETAKGILFFRKNSSFFHLYYCTSSLNDLNILISDYLPDEHLVLDLIGKPVSLNGLLSLFINVGFKKYTELQRYSRINKDGDNFYESQEDVIKATQEDAEVITQLFEKNFNKVSEQVPDLREVKKAIEEARISVVKDEDVIKGFLVETSSGQSTILNNFLVGESYRGQRVGSKLLRNYIFKSSHRKRMTLWVVFDNETALNVYRKYGYVKDDLIDVILVKR